MSAAVPIEYCCISPFTDSDGRSATEIANLTNKTLIQPRPIPPACIASISSDLTRTALL